MFFLVNANNYSVSELVFWAAAFFGSTLFIVRLCISAMSGLTDDIDSSGHGHDGHMVAHDGTEHYHSASSSFKLFTIHSLSGFFMMFGWVGLACLNQLSMSQHASCIAAFFAGFTIMIVTALIFHGARLLVSEGTQFDIKKTIGSVGVVYQKIPSDGQGKIQLVVDGITRELLAQSLDHRIIASFKNVCIVKVVDHETVVVKEIHS